MIEVKNISKMYGSKSIIDNVSINIKPGKITSFIGPNGAGKSTVLGIITRILSRDSGEVYIDGRELGQWKSDELSRVIAILKQSNQLNVRLNVRDLVAFGRFPYSKGRLTQEDNAKIDEVLAYMELESMQYKFLEELSGGQKQRAYIAMVLAQDTDYIFLDEPLNNLDMKHSVQIMKILRKIVDELGKTVILVIHDINFAASYSDEIIALQDGKVVIHDEVENTIEETVLAGIYDMEFNIQEVRGKKVCVYY